MRAIQVTGFGPPEVLTLATVPDPTPAPGEVRVRVHAIGVNFSDTERRRAVFDPPELPWIPGREAAGVIDVVGEGVDPALVGARVASYSRRRGGSYAELATVAVDELLHFPDSVPFATMAAVPVQGLTAWGLVHFVANVRSGDVVLLHAAAGGLVHEGADGVVDQQVRPDLLADPSGRGCVAPPGAALVGLGLVQRGLGLRIRRRQLRRGCPLRVQDGGGQPVALLIARAAGIVPAVVDDPHRDALALGVAGAKLACPGAVGKDFQHLQLDALAAAPQQLRGGRVEGTPQLQAAQALVDQQQHPRPSERASEGASEPSPRCSPPMAASTTAWVPHSTSPTRRTCGNAPCPRPPVGRPNAATLAGVSATSSVVPSSATSRHPRYHAPFVLQVASGRATSANSARSGAVPSLALARAIELLSGICQRLAYARPSTSSRMTSS